MNIYVQLENGKRRLVGHHGGENSMPVPPNGSTVIYNGIAYFIKKPATIDRDNNNITCEATIVMCSQAVTIAKAFDVKLKSEGSSLNALVVKHTALLDHTAENMFTDFWLTKTSEPITAKDKLIMRKMGLTPDDFE